MAISGNYCLGAVVRAIKEVYPSDKVYKDYQEQNFKRPCFFVKQLLLTNSKRMNNRYERLYRFRITWYPPSGTAATEEACNSVGETLLGVFRILKLDDTHSTFGRNLEYEVVDGELRFTAEFNIEAVWSSGEEDPIMGNLSADTHIK